MSETTTPTPAAAASTPAAAPVATATAISKKRKIVQDGLFHAELNSFLQRELGEEGYAGVEVRVTPLRTEIIIRATRTQNVLGEKGRRIRELTSLVQKRFQFPEGTVELYAERVQNRALSAIAQAESLRFKLLGGLPIRRACYGVMRYVMDNGAKGVELIIGGKTQGQRAKAMKFRDGYMIRSGDAKQHYVDYAVRHLQLKQGMIGVKVKIQLPHDPTGRDGIANKLPDVVTIADPKEDFFSKVAAPYAQNVNVPEPTPAPAAAPATGAPAASGSAPVAQTQGGGAAAGSADTAH
jgi:small subunit ribosomal protein S3e